MKSSIFCNVKIWSLHPCPSQNPACSFRRMSSTAWVIRIVTFQKILLGTDRRVIQRQLLQSLKDSDGISSCSKIFVNKGLRITAASSGSALNSSAFTLSWPGAISIFRELSWNTVCAYVKLGCGFLNVWHFWWRWSVQNLPKVLRPAPFLLPLWCQ